MARVHRSALKQVHRPLAGGVVLAAALLATAATAQEWAVKAGGTQTDFGNAIAGDGSLRPCFVPMTNADHRFFRVRQP
jgi:hypothetical protein